MDGDASLPLPASPSVSIPKVQEAIATAMSGPPHVRPIHAYYRLLSLPQA
jgi:hypothetical protein